MEPKLISYSQIYAWNRCRFLWELRYPRRIARRITERPLSLGGAVHRGIDGGISTKGDLSAVAEGVQSYIDEWKTKIMRQMDDDELEHIMEVEQSAHIIARNSIRNIDFDRWETVIGPEGEPMVERRIVVPISRSRYWDGFVFVCDWVARDAENGLVWVIYHKVRRQFLPEDAEEVNQQAAVYQYALREIGIETAGSICHNVRSNPPKIPSLNKNGSMSKAKIATTWEVYRETLLAHGLDPADYEEDMKPKLAEVVFERWDKAFRGEAEINAVWNDVIVPASQAISRKHKKIWRALNYMACNGCSMRELCLAELRGYDTEWLLATDYIDKNNPIEGGWNIEDLELVEDDEPTTND